MPPEDLSIDDRLAKIELDVVLMQAKGDFARAIGTAIKEAEMYAAQHAPNEQFVDHLLYMIGLQYARTDYAAITTDIAEGNSAPTHKSLPPKRNRNRKVTNDVARHLASAKPLAATEQSLNAQGFKFTEQVKDDIESDVLKE